MPIKQDRFGPAFAGSEHVAVREAAAGGEYLKVGERRAAAEDIAHVHVDRGEAGAIDGGGHFDLSVHTLFAQNRDFWSWAREDQRRGDIVVDIKGGVDGEPGKARVQSALMFLLRAAHVVSQGLHPKSGVGPRRAERAALAFE